MKNYALATTLLALTATSFGALRASTPSEPASAPAIVAEVDANTVHVVQHPGYFETQGNVFQRAAGAVTFVVENRSGKDAGFVLAREGSEPTVIMIANGETGRLETELQAGSYTYSCPIIPTPGYPLSVK